MTDYYWIKLLLSCLIFAPGLFILALAVMLLVGSLFIKK